MNLTEVFASMRGSEKNIHSWKVDIPSDWSQGRSAFGGLQSAIALHAMRTIVPNELSLRALQTTFIAPVANTVEVTITPLRQGKHTMHVEARLLDNNNRSVAAIMVGVFARARPSQVAITPPPPNVDSEIDRTRKPIPYTPGVSLGFIQQFAIRWLAGGVPFSSSKQRDTMIEVSLLDDAPMDEERVVAIADVIPPIGLSMLTTPAPGSSMTWLLEILRDKVDDLSPKGWLLDAKIVGAAGGYTNQTVTVWGPGRVPVAFSTQTMLVLG